MIIEKNNKREFVEVRIEPDPGKKLNYLYEGNAEELDGNVIISFPHGFNIDSYISSNYMETIPDDQPAEEVVQQLSSFARFAINLAPMSDMQALAFKDIHPEWHEFIQLSLGVGNRVKYEDRLYKVRQDIPVVLPDQFPGIATAALYEEINEDVPGTLEHPIPYNGNMELEEGKYYSQYDITYLCIESSGQAVTHDLQYLPRYVRPV